MLYSWWAVTFTLPFDKETWISANPPDSIGRSSMVKTLIENSVLIGKTKSEIISLLGRSQSDNNPNEFSYHTIEEYSFNFEVSHSEHFVLKFDPITKKVRECGIQIYFRSSGVRYKILQTQ